MNKVFYKNKFFLCFLIFLLCFIGIVLIEEVFNVTLFYMIPNFIFIPLLLCILSLSLYFITKKMRVLGMFAFIAFLGLLLLIISLTDFHSQSIKTNLPNTDTSITITKTDVKLAPDADRLTVTEIIIPFLLSKQYNTGIKASGASLSEMIEISQDENGVVMLLYDDVCYMIYDNKTKTWQNY